ncbi:MAG: VanZ family protein [Gammaproteobacteria bacterium]|jgi:VanZ family protein
MGDRVVAEYMTDVGWRYLGLWRAVGTGLIMVVVFLTLASAPIVEGIVEINDKIGHFIAYATLMGWHAQYIGRDTRSQWAVGFVAMGVVLELLQGASGWRTMDVADIVANSTGVVAGAIVSVFGCAGWLRRLDNALARIGGRWP